MTELFNHFNRSVTGQAFDGQAPVQLRIEQGSASRAQVQAVQAAYAQFARRATFSQVPNPMERGQLLDGSAYRIVTVGNTTIVQLWPKQSTGSLRMSGISFEVVGMDWRSVPEHSTKDGVPFVYLLTPVETEKGSRISSGQFKVKKLQTLTAGNHAIADASGEKYAFASFARINNSNQSNINAAFMTSYGLVGKYRPYQCFLNYEELIRSTVARAAWQNGYYQDKYRQTSLDFFSFSDSTSVNAPGAMFFHTDIHGRVNLMSLDFEDLERSTGYPSAAKIKLYSIKLNDGTGRGVDITLRHEIEVEGLFYMPSLTFNATGTKAKIHCGQSGLRSVVDLEISAYSLSYSTREKESDTDVQESGAPADESSYSNGHYDEYGNWIITESGNEIKEDKSRITKSTSEGGDNFDRLGNLIPSFIFENTTYSDYHYFEKNDNQFKSVDGYSVVDTQSKTRTEEKTTIEDDAFIKQRYGTSHSKYVLSEIEKENSFTHGVGYTSGHQIIKSITTEDIVSPSVVLFEDFVTDFYIAIIYTQKYSRETLITRTTISGPEFTEDVITEEVDDYWYDLVISKGGRIIAKEKIEEFKTRADFSLFYAGDGGDARFTVRAAKDPKTECIVVCLEKIGLINSAGGAQRRGVLKHWTYAIGKSYITPLEKIINGLDWAKGTTTRNLWTA